MSRRLYETWGDVLAPTAKGTALSGFGKVPQTVWLWASSRRLASFPASRGISRSAEMRGEKEVGNSTASAVPPHSITIRALPTDGSASLPA